jgi:kynurenine 3-monooxygenase
MNSQETVIIGGGLVGSLLATALQREGRHVHVYEQRPDLRLHELDGGRSVNLVVTSRGIHALHRLGLSERILSRTVAVSGRMIHPIRGNLVYQPYGTEAHHRNYSVSRAELNKMLISEAESEGVHFHFEHKLATLDFSKKQATFQTPQGTTDVFFRVAFGTDGAGSQGRHQLLEALKQQGVPAEESVDFLEASYKELMIPKEEAKRAKLEPHALHIWPRGSHMLMALPNLDGSFTVTLYLAAKGKLSFESIRNGEDILRYFDEYFADAIPLMPELVKDFLNHPTGLLGTVRCNPWHFNGTFALLGDAAHAVVPFFGQGMNAGFEDVTVLLNLLCEYAGNWEKTLEAYSEERKPNGDAIADMALENYDEMREKVGDAKFLLMKRIEQILEREFPTRYQSRYVLVTQTTVPYAEAQRIGRIQNRILTELCAQLTSPEDVDLKLAAKLIERELTPS